MGKKHKHSKDKLYKTVQELQSHHVGANRDLELSTLHRRLKFDTCCLTLDTISDKPMGLCDDDGFCYVFECDRIIKFLQKFQIHPITGKKIASKDLIELKFHRNNENAYHCPIIYKLFNQYSKIVANKKTGHVYSYEAYRELNLKPNNFKDLLTDEPFEKDDIVTIQEPSKADTKWVVSDFHYVKNNLKIDDEANDSNVRNIDSSSVIKASLEEFKSKEKSFMETFNRLTGQENASGTDVVLDMINSASYSDGNLARSVTSSVMPVAVKQKPALLSNEQILYPMIKKKGYVQMVTNFGPINLELHCDRTPKTCHNFLLLASRGYYDNTCFHRLIKNFIIQGGDPTGTGTGGESAWGDTFKDECHGDLKHIGRGILSMANSGPATNKSQFYITLKGNWDHLDGKHTVFGRVVGGNETLGRMEAVEVDKNDRPKEEIKILHIIKFTDPFEDAEAAIAEQRSEKSKTREEDSNGKQVLKKFRSGIGSYIDPKLLIDRKAKYDKELHVATVEQTTPKDESDIQKTSGLTQQLATVTNKKTKSIGDFSNW